MKKLMKQTLAVLIAVLLVFGSAPLAALEGLDFSVLDNIFSFRAEAASYSGTCGENLTWTLDTETGELVISGEGEMTSTPWYSRRSSIKTVIISDSVTSIGIDAFYGCTELINITIPDSVISIGDKAFADCDSLVNIAIPDTVTSMGDRVFNFCNNLTSVVIGNGITTIGEHAFYWCSNLRSITISNSVTSIGDSAFFSCHSLTDVYYVGTEEQWNAINISDTNEPLASAKVHYNYKSANNSADDNSVNNTKDEGINKNSENSSSSNPPSKSSSIYVVIFSLLAAVSLVVAVIAIRKKLKK